MAQITMGNKMICAGTSACIADIFTFPFDVAKVRLQILGEVDPTIKQSSNTRPVPRGLFGTLLFISKNEGPKSLWGGIGPGLQRQCVFASIRVGLYDSIKDFYSDFLGSSSATSIMAVRMASGITSGSIAICFAQPTDVVKVRMQAQMRGATNAVRYASSFKAYQNIYKTEGIKGLWKGLGPNALRNSVVNATELVCYDTIKESLINHKIMDDGLPCHFSSAFGAGFFATVVASPVDVIKTRIMNSNSNQYSGIIDCARQLVRQGGFLAFYKGFTPSFMRLGTWNIFMFVVFEQLKIRVLQYKEASALTPKQSSKMCPHDIIPAKKELLQLPAL